MIVKIDCFDPALIARSGQCFRMRTDEKGATTAVAGADRVRIQPLGGGLFHFDCGQEQFDSRWRVYFDLDTDYAAIERDAAGRDAYLKRAAGVCKGLRILRQDPWETLISFLISQRKSIPAIQTCVEALCTRYGARSGRGRYFSFPTPDALLSAGEKGLRACGLGYRAPYLLDAAQRATDGRIDLTAMNGLSDEELLNGLMQIYGVGRKVAGCVMLFGYHRLATAPVDVWVRRAIDENYGGKSPFPGYGRHAGVFQQYLFYIKISGRA